MCVELAYFCLDKHPLVFVSSKHAAIFFSLLPLNCLVGTQARTEFQASSLSDGKTLTGGLFLGETEGRLVGLNHLAALFKAVELNVTVGAQVGRNATVGSVGTSAALNGSLDDNVVDHALVRVKLVSFSVGLEVDDEFANDLHGLLGPSSLASLELFALSMSAHTSCELSEWNNLFVLQHVVEVNQGGLKVEALHSAGRLISVLKVSSQIRGSALSGYVPSTNHRQRVRSQIKRDEFVCVYLHLVESAG